MASRFVRRLASGYRASASIEPGLRPGNTGGPVYGKNLPGTGAGYGGMIIPPAGKGVVKAATTSVRYVSPGQPMYSEWDGRDAIEKGYLGHGYVMRCVRLRAETIGALPFVGGPDPNDPTVTDPNAQLCRFLGPATPQAPGGPNPQVDARNMWIWTVIQHIVTGRFGWELVRGGDSRTAPILELWPLVSGLLQPIPAPWGSDRYFGGANPDKDPAYIYQTPLGDRPLKDYQCLYHWRMSASDPYQAESVLQAAMMPTQIAIASDKYMWGLLSQGMVAPKMVITPDFEEDAARRAWEDQFTSNYTGYDNAGKVLFGYIDGDTDAGPGSGTAAERANVQVIDLAMKSVDAQLLQMVAQAKVDIEIALGVPESLIGNSSQRIFANADSEYRNFWTTTALSDVAELQDAINLRLAPQLDPKIAGWFDLSSVVALQPQSIFAPPDVKDMLDEGVVTTQDVQKILNLNALEEPAEDVETAPLGEEAVQSGAVGGRSIIRANPHKPFAPGNGYRQVYHGMRLAENVFVRKLPLTTYTLGVAGRPGSGIWRVERRRERAKLASGTRAETPALVREVTAKAAEVRRKREGIRSADRIAGLEAENAMLRAAQEPVVSGDGALDEIDALLELCGAELLAAVQPG